jgi:hypothetical protein
MRRTHVPLALTLMVASCNLASHAESDSSEPSPISGNRSRIAGQAWAAPSCAFGDPACESPYFPLHAQIRVVGAQTYQIETDASTGSFSIDIEPGEYQVSARSLADEVSCSDMVQVAAPPGFVVPVRMVCVGPQ